MRKGRKIKKGYFSVTVLSGVFLLFLVSTIFYLYYHFPSNTKKSVSQNLIASSKFIVITITPTFIPTPTKNLSYAKPAGFCLNVPVLLYHHVEPSAQAQSEGHTALNVDNGWFDKQMAYLNQKGYTSISADQLVQAIIHHQGLSPKSIVITLDDGYQDIYTYAYPIAQKYHIILNLMIPTGLLNNPDYLNWDELKNMVGSGQVFAYDHTWSHASLGGASMEKIRYEIMTAKTQLEQNLGRTVSIFAYPYGSEGEKVINFLTSNGFIAAFSTVPGYWQCDSFIMSLHRNRIGSAPLSSYGL